MTPKEFDQRLGDLIETCDFKPYPSDTGTCMLCGRSDSNSLHMLEQDIRQLFKDAVGEDEKSVSGLEIPGYRPNILRAELREIVKGEK